MNSIRFWVAVITSVSLAITGYFLAVLFPLPEPFNLRQTKYIYVAWGILTGLLFYTKVSSWIVRGVTGLVRSLILRLASEIIHQLTSITTSTLPFSGSHDGGKYNPSRFYKPLIIDTSAIIDGRLLEVSQTGFLSGIFVVPDFVLSELQQVADSADFLKRSRGRRGFEIIEELKKIDGVKVEVWDKALRGKNVDDKLIRLAKALKGKILTVDFNLNKVATISGVTVLNINDLVNSLKALPIPGEKLSIKIAHVGKDKDQGVGYLTDGTMIIVKDGSDSLGKTLNVEVNKILQGPAGRMIFAQQRPN